MLQSINAHAASVQEWKARYEAVLMGIDNPAYIENAERAVRVAIDMAATSAQPFEIVWNAMRELIGDQQTMRSRAHSHMLGP